MVLKPTTLPMWAEQDVLDPITGQYNVVEPPPEKQLEGWAFHEFPPRNWFNWLARYTYRWINYLRQQEELSVLTDGNGVGLFPSPPAGVGLCILTAVDITNPGNYLFAVGSINAGTIQMNIIDNNVLTVAVTPVVGPNLPVTGGTAANILVNGQTKAVAQV